MKKAIFSLTFSLLLLLPAIWQQLQAQALDLSEYKARYARRPGLSWQGQFNYAGRLSPDYSPGVATALFTSTEWFLNRNTDAKVSTFSLSGSFRTNYQKNEGSPFIPAQETGNINLDALLFSNTLYYRPSGQYWGWSFSSRMDLQQPLTQLGGRRSTALIAPSVFAGTGRIEEAQDALLANWILQDLQAAGVIQAFRPADADTLARAITAIIGNRTFDLRRRRIYELQQLYAALVSTGLADAESFELFAIINDNWAFANRAVLTHGTRWQYGLQAQGLGLSTNDVSDFQSSPFRSGIALARLYGGVNRSRIINNNGSHTLDGTISVEYFHSFAKQGTEDTQTTLEGWATVLNCNYTRTWLPNSRTTIAWRNSFFLDYHINQQRAFGEDGNLLSSSFASTGLQMDYFISYQWAFQLNADVQAAYLQPNEEVRFSPILNFRTQYFFF